MAVLNEFKVKNEDSNWKSVDFVQSFNLLPLLLNLYFSISAFGDLMELKLTLLYLSPENAIPIATK